MCVFGIRVCLEIRVHIFGLCVDVFRDAHEGMRVCLGCVCVLCDLHVCVNIAQAR